MAEGKRYYWMKFQEDFFDSKRIKKLRKLGADFVIIYLKMQLKALRSGGVLEFTGVEESIVDEIALDIDEDPDKVQLTLSYLQSCGLMETNSSGDIFLPYVEKNTGSETASAQRVRDFRNRQKLLHCNASVTEVKRECNVEKEIEKEIDIYNVQNSDFEREFSELYGGYPKKVGKATAKKKYKVLRKKYSAEQILAGVKAYYIHKVEENGGEVGDKKFWKDFDTLMNQIENWIPEGDGK